MSGSKSIIGGNRSVNSVGGSSGGKSNAVDTRRRYNQTGMSIGNSNENIPKSSE